MRVHLILGKNDGDIVYWKSTLPSFTFSKYVSKILLAESKKKIADVPVPEKNGHLQKKLDVTIYVNDKQVIRLIESMPKMKRGKYIKRIVRKHINANYRLSDDQPETEDPEETEISQIEEMKNEELTETISDYRAKILRMTGR